MSAPTRRALLGAIAIAPLAVVPIAVATVAAPSVDRSAWDAAMAVYSAAKAHEDRYDAETLTPLWQELERQFGPHAWKRELTPAHKQWLATTGFRDVEAHADDLACAAHDAKWLLLLMPAPDLAALRFKLEDLTNESEGIQPYNAAYVSVLVADYRRLLPVEARS